MIIQDIANLKGYRTVVMTDATQTITDGYTSDLLSDVMGNAPDDSVLITIQAHKNTIAVASLAGIKAIVICNDRTTPHDMKEAAEKEDVAIFETADSQFIASWNIAKLLGK